MVSGFLLCQASSPTISFQDGLFVVSDAAGSTDIPIAPQAAAMYEVTGRLWLPVAGRVVTFDGSGVGIRENNRISTSTYPDIATTSKLFSKEECDEINRSIAREERTLDVNALSGWEKVGSKVYLLLRWNLKDGQPWLEALVEIDLSTRTPSARLLGRFAGFTYAKGRVNDKLIFENGQLLAMTRDGDQVKVSAYNLGRNDFHSENFGSSNGDLKLIEGGTFGIVIEKNPVGTLLIGLVDRRKNQIRDAAEIRGSILGTYSPCLLHFFDGSTYHLRDLESGGELNVPQDFGIASINAGILIWTPKDRPQTAALYVPTTFRTLARWAAE